MKRDEQSSGAILDQFLGQLRNPPPVSVEASREHVLLNIRSGREVRNRVDDPFDFGESPSQRRLVLIAAVAAITLVVTLSAIIVSPRIPSQEIAPEQVTSPVLAHPPQRQIEPLTARLEFEVASIRPSRPGVIAARGAPGQGAPGAGLFVSPGRIRFVGATVEECIRVAYGLHLVPPATYQLTGMPDGLGTWDIEARAAGRASNDELMQMLRSLLADRFRLKAHYEKRELPVYKLVVGKNGHKLLATEPPPRPEPEGPETNLRLETLQSANQVVPRRVQDPLTGAGRTEYEAKMYMPRFALFLARMLGNKGPVHDETGLEGMFSFTFAPEPITPVIQQDPAATFAAVERLGLQLQESRGPVDVLVIDHVERASEN
jgi:uncharacterized protein (TIGR03435 family)